MDGKGLLDALAANLTSLLLQGLEGLFGPGINRDLVGSISVGEAVSFVFLVLLVLGVNGVVSMIARRWMRRAKAQPEAEENWRTQIFHAALRPVYVAVWIYGIYFAVYPLLLDLESGQPNELHPARLLVDKLFDLGLFAVLLWLFLRLTRVLEKWLATWAGTTPGRMDDLLIQLLGRSLRVIVPVVGIIFALPLIGLSSETSGVVAKGSSILLIGAVAWVLIQAVRIGEQAVLAKYDITAEDNLQARKVYTQVHVLSKALYVLIAIFTAASVLMLFEEVRRFGTSLLASAGVVGVIAGFAAQRTIANLFAGFQLAMTQPIRLDDVVIVEGEWGRIEEITLTYVVVHIWDDRRLIVPLSHFIERPFQNWTRVSAELLGSVFFWADYTLPITELRAALKPIVESCRDWDRRFWNLQVTETTERAMQLRVLATAADASKAWDLRCELREKILVYLQEHYPRSLPRVRAEMSRLPEASSAPG